MNKKNKISGLVYSFPFTKELSINSRVKLWNGVEMPIFGFGTFLLRDDEVKMPLKNALESGYRLIDTAKLYSNESQIGEVLSEFLKTNTKDIKREDLFITTKLWKGDIGYKSTKEAFQKSLTQLGLDYIDLYLIHWPGVDDVIKNPSTSNAIKIRKETWKAMEEIYKSGKARAIGVSNFTVRHLKQLLEDQYDEDASFPKINITPMVNQFEVHPTLTQTALRNYCDKQGIWVQGYCSLGRGQLISDADVVRLAKKYQRKESQVLIRWSLQHRIGVIPKSRDEGRIKMNAEVFDFELDEVDVKSLDKKNQDWHVSWNPTNIV